MYQKNDPVYLDSEQFGKAKASFVTIIEILRSYTEGCRPISLLDLGCANGSFLYHVRQCLEVGRAVGVDCSDQLTRFARENQPGVEFITADLQKPLGEELKDFDICTCFGTLCLFDDIEFPLKNLIGSLRPGGLAIIYDLVNKYPVDVWMRYKEITDSTWRPAYNVRSEETWQRLICAIDANIEIEITPFLMPYSLPETPDFMRAWTIGTEEVNHQLISGVGQKLDFSVICAKKPLTGEAHEISTE